MSNGIPSLFKWRSQAEFDRALENHERAKQQNITVEELEKRDEAQRLEKLPTPIEPENQKAISDDVEKTAFQKALTEYGWSQVDYEDAMGEAATTYEEGERLRDERDAAYDRLDASTKAELPHDLDHEINDFSPELYKELNDNSIENHDDSFDWSEYKHYAETMSPDEPDYHSDTNEKEWFESDAPEQEQSQESSVSEPTDLEPDI